MLPAGFRPGACADPRAQEPSGTRPTDVRVAVVDQGLVIVLEQHRPAGGDRLFRGSSLCSSWGSLRMTPWCTADLTAVPGGPPLVFIDTVS
jgi:hypothetical protein